MSDKIRDVGTGPFLEYPDRIEWLEFYAKEDGTVGWRVTITTPTKD